MTLMRLSPVKAGIGAVERSEPDMMAEMDWTQLGDEDGVGDDVSPASEQSLAGDRTT
jgi:hypothetical protein